MSIARPDRLLPTGISIAEMEFAMNASLYQAAAALNANARWQELISQNIASGVIPGFKKREISIGAIAFGVMRNRDGTISPGTLPHATAAINFRQGEMKVTDDKTDMALQGPGFFTIQLPDGTEAYTRDGEFRIDPFGQLVTKHGFPVLGTGGPIRRRRDVATDDGSARLRGELQGGAIRRRDDADEQQPET